MQSRFLARAATVTAAFALAAATAAAPGAAFAEVPGVDTSALAVTSLIDQQLAAATQCDFHSSVTDGMRPPGVNGGYLVESASMQVYIAKTGAGRCPGGLPSGSVINQVTITDQSVATHTVVGRGLNGASASQSVYYIGVPPVAGSEAASIAGNAEGVVTYKFEGFLSTAPSVSLFCVLDVWQANSVQGSEVVATPC